MTFEVQTTIESYFNRV